MGVPVDYELAGSTMTENRKQIGNMVSPVVWKAVIREAKQTLEAFDEGRIDSGDRAINPARQRTAAPRTRLSEEPQQPSPAKRMRQLSIVSDASSRTLSPDPVPQKLEHERRSRGPTGRGRASRRAPNEVEVIDLTDD